eukprot:6196771-Pleurochrysis_carterae.AAC.1
MGMCPDERQPDISSKPAKKRAVYEFLQYRIASFHNCLALRTHSNGGAGHRASELLSWEAALPDREVLIATEDHPMPKSTREPPVGTHNMTVGGDISALARNRASTQKQMAAEQFRDTTDTAILIMARSRLGIGPDTIEIEIFNF